MHIITQVPVIPILTNLIAFSLPLFLFAFFSLIGLATLSLLNTQRNTLQNILLAPAIGVALTLLPIFWINRYGIPINQFALQLCICLILFSIVILSWKKPLFPIKYYWPFAGVLFLALLLIGRPLLQFGFDWVSFCNDDMANYCLAAARFAKHGYFDIPSVDDLIQAKDYSLFYWFMHVPGLSRSGCELILAFVSSVTQLTPLQIFMPVILCLHLTLISVTSALVCQANYKNIYKNKRKIALIAGLLLAFSAQNALGSLYQLIAQVSGLSLLIASLILLLQPFQHHKKYLPLSQAILLAIIVTALLITYPEVLPFSVISFVIYFILITAKGWRINQAFCLTLALTAIFIVIFANFYLLNAFYFILGQSTKGTSSIFTEKLLFPYYLLPSGFADFWGLKPIAYYGALSRLDSWYSPATTLTIKILCGFLFSLMMLTLIIKNFFDKRDVAPIVVLVMLALGIWLFINVSDFGLFKLSMYIQPFIIATIATSLFYYFHRWLPRAFIVITFILLNFSTLHYYVNRSRALTPGNLTEIAYASHTKINTEFKNLIANLPADAILVSNDFNIVSMKFQSFMAVNKPLIQPVTMVWNNVINSLIRVNKRIPKTLLNNHFLDKMVFRHKETFAAFYKYYATKHNMQTFSLLNIDKDQDQTHFIFCEIPICVDNHDCSNRIYLINNTNIRGILNSRHFPSNQATNFVITPLNQVHNILNFVDSSIGQIYYSKLFLKENVSLYKFETDILFPNHIMQSVGRYLLFRIYNPTPKVRLALSITNTLDGDGDNKLPEVLVIGDQRIQLPLIGRGAARVFSQPFTPQIINGIPYITIDMNRSAKMFPKVMSGIMKLYGTSHPLDVRQTVSFARDISVISDDDYQMLNPPSLISRFPEDLMNQDLEYSGIYEDGWIGEHAFFRLKQLATSNHLLIRGVLAKINRDFSGTHLTILLDSKKIAESTLKPGEFTLKIRIPETTPVTQIKKIELQFSQLQKLPNGDNRPEAAQISLIGFV